MEQKKSCIHCGAELPADASFCPRCAGSQTERTKVTPPNRRWKRPLIYTLAALAAVLAVCLTVRGLRAALEPEGEQFYEGEAQLYYEAGGGSYQLFLMLNNLNPPLPEPEKTIRLREGELGQNPSQLWITAEGAAAEDFFDLVENCTVETTPLDGGIAATSTAPAYDPNFPGAALVSNIRYSADCKTNEISWTLHMKNGDTLRLTQRIAASLLPTLVYDSTNAKLDTAQDLQDLLDQIKEEAEPGTAVRITLPAVVYEGEISLSGPTVSLYGTGTTEARTTFTGPVTAEYDGTEVTFFENLTFAGDGKGTGLSSASGIVLTDCSFTGWDTGALAMDGAWLAPTSCIFADNGVGLEFNSSHAHYSDRSFSGNQFLRNGTGLKLTWVPGGETFIFPRTAFLENEVDIDNLCGHPTDTSQAAFD